MSDRDIHKQIFAIGLSIVDIARMYSLSTEYASAALTTWGL